MALYPEILFRLMGDRGLLLEFGDEISLKINQKVRRMSLAIKRERIEGVIETVPTYRSLLIVYHPLIISLEDLKRKIKEIEGGLEEIDLPQPNLTRIPVVYGSHYGPDLEEVATYCEMTPEEVIRLHCSVTYHIYMIGFMPGFPYMGELPDALVIPRLKTPRLSVPAGSVGIAQKQTGIYPMESPGGWRLIGKTPLKMFDPNKEPPSLLQMGDLVQFYPISENEFKEWGKDNSQMEE
jgi:KipI family sensor histidine kinase inhibitor